MGYTDPMLWVETDNGVGDAAEDALSVPMRRVDGASAVEVLS